MGGVENEKSFEIRSVAAGVGSGLMQGGWGLKSRAFRLDPRGDLPAAQHSSSSQSRAQHLPLYRDAIASGLCHSIGNYTD